MTKEISRVYCTWNSTHSNLVDTDPPGQIGTILVGGINLPGYYLDLDYEGDP